MRLVISNREIVEPNPVNPYQPPSPGVGYGMDLGPSPTGLRLADVWTRFVGAMMDGLLYIPVVIPGFLIQAVMGNGEDLTGLALGSMLMGILGLAIVQWYMIATSGQSIAKRLLRMRIVRLDGSQVNFVHGVLLRSWLMGLLTNIPLIGFMVALIDGLMIFGNDRRCLHDRIADTTVIKI